MWPIGLGHYRCVWVYVWAPRLAGPLWREGDAGEGRSELFRVSVESEPRGTMLLVRACQMKQR